MLSQPVPSQLGQVLPFLRCQKAAANHGAEKNPSAPVWQAVFSTSHGVAVYIDSTALPVCDNHRINRHKVFAGLAQRGKTSMGWFFDFKLHLVFNTDNEIVALKLTPGNVHDTTPVPALTRELTGKLFGDKGYIGQKLAEDLLRRGLTLFTRVRKNMKSLPLSLQDKALLKARNMADIGHIKEFSSLNLSKHRSAINAFVHIIAAITAYQINPFKPKLNLQPRYQLETIA